MRAYEATAEALQLRAKLLAVLLDVGLVLGIGIGEVDIAIITSEEELIATRCWVGHCFECTEARGGNWPRWQAWLDAGIVRRIEIDIGANASDICPVDEGHIRAQHLILAQPLVKDLGNLPLDLIAILARAATPHLALDDRSKSDSLVKIELLSCEFVDQTIVLNLLIHMSKRCLERRLWPLISWHRVRITKDIALERGASWLIGKERTVVRLSECSFDRFLTVASSLECCGGSAALDC